jgi:hypothetical protein
MEEDNPITRHLKLQMRFVTTRRFFLRFREYRTHARMRHVSLNRNVRSRNQLTVRIGQLESDRNRPDAGRSRGDFVFNLDRNWRLGSSGTAG